MNGTRAVTGVFRDEGPILEELRLLGLNVEHIEDLYLRHLDYRAAMANLVAWIPRVRDPTVKEMLVRAVTDRHAGPLAGPMLVREFQADDVEAGSLRWTIGNAIDAVADAALVDDMLRLVANREYGTDRQMVVNALGRFRRPDVVRALVGLLDDPTVNGHAVAALARLKDPRTASAMRGFVDDDRAWVRRAARKAIADLDRRQDRPAI